MGAPIEEEERLVGDAAEGDKPADLLPASHPALNESDIDVESGIGQSLQVLEGSLGGKDLQLHAVPRQYLRVSFGICPEEAPLGSARYDEGVRRCRMEEPKDGEKHDGSCQKAHRQRSCPAEPQGLRNRCRRPSKTRSITFLHRGTPTATSRRLRRASRPPSLFLGFFGFCFSP